MGSYSPDLISETGSCQGGEVALLLRVPTACSTGAFLAFLSILALLKINKLRVLSDRKQSESPLSHQQLTYCVEVRTDEEKQKHLAHSRQPGPPKS